MEFYYTSQRSCLATALNLILSANKDMDIYRHALMSKCDYYIKVNVTAHMTVLLEYINLYKFSLT